MPLKHPVPCDFISKDKINAFLNKRVKDVAKDPKRSALKSSRSRSSASCRPISISPPKKTVDLLTEQAVAFYGYDKKKRPALCSRVGLRRFGARLPAHSPRPA
jgi:hypothetical protein